MFSMGFGIGFLFFNSKNDTLVKLFHRSFGLGVFLNRQTALFGKVPCLFLTLILSDGLVLSYYSRNKYIFYRWDVSAST